ncbi:MAG: type II toxin-antitoxin system YafQ family toxin [Candidatus Paceibacterota bacterium]|jgi:mRNA-degrading endonuclease YafQ of YafQ-DinJ toxin-antitoxin module
MPSILHKSFIKRYSRMDKKVQMAFIKRFDAFSKNPFDPTLENHELHAEWSHHRSINVTGDIRAIYRTDGGITIFVAIGTHSELYE